MQENIGEIIIISSIVLGVLLVSVLLMLIALLRRKSSDQQTYKELGMLEATVKNIQQVSHNLKEGLLSIENRLEERQRIDELNQQMIRRLDHIIAGTKSKGMAGENVLAQTLSEFPPEMIARNQRIKSKEVEFALVLSDGRLVPIDSKWTSTAAAEDLSAIDDPAKRTSIINQAQREIKKKVQEVTTYIDAEITAPLAICAVPDAVFSLTQQLAGEAYKKNVVLISYSLLLPYLLTLYHLHLQYSREADIENIYHYLLEAKQNILQMYDVLENKLIRSQVMLSNATEEFRSLLISLKNSLSRITERKT